MIFTLTSREPFSEKQTCKPYTLVGPTVTRPVQDPLAVTGLKNRLCMHDPFESNKVNLGAKTCLLVTFVFKRVV